MDGLHKLDAALLAATSSPAQQLVAAVSGGASVLFVGQAGTADCLRVLGRMLGAARTRVLHVHPPLDLTDFMEQVASAFPAAPGQCALERGFRSLTALDANCDRISLLVEDAHLLPHPTLRYIELALRSGPHLQVVLAGQPALMETLDLPGFASLRQRLSVRVDATEPQREPLPAVVVPIANARRNRRPAVLAGALAASVAMVAWSLHSFVAEPDLQPTVVTAEAVTAPSSEPLSPTVPEASAIRASIPDAFPAPEPIAPITVAQKPEAPVPAEVQPPVPDATLTAPTIVAQVPEAPVPLPAEAPSAVPDVALGPALTVEAPPSVLVPDATPTPQPTAPVVLTQVPEAPAPVPAEVQLPVQEAALSPVLTTDAPRSTSVPEAVLDPASPAIVAMLPVSPQVPPPRARPSVAASPISPRQVLVRPTPVRPERVGSVVPASAQSERRCRNIVLRVQLGEVPDDGDRTFLRNGCR